MNVDRFYIFVVNHKFVDNVDVRLKEMPLDIDFLNQLHKNLEENYFI